MRRNKVSTELFIQCFHFVICIWHAIYNIPNIIMLSAAQTAQLWTMEGKAFVSLGIYNLIMVCAALSELFPVDPMTLLASLTRLSYSRNKILMVVVLGFQRAESLNCK